MPDNTGFNLQLGQGYLALKRWDDAERVLKHVLELDSDNAQAFLGLARVGLATRRNFEAASDALTSVGLLYHNPPAHYLLGMALHRIGRVKHAVRALDICVAQNPNFLPAQRRLVMIYSRRLKMPKKAEAHRKIIKEILKSQRQQAVEARRRRRVKILESGSAAAKDKFAPALPSPAPKKTQAEIAIPLDPPRKDAPFITVVSGLPRSGTSLMMQMLAAGGLPAMHDAHRPADSDNPLGYFEFAQAKNLRANVSWLPRAKGRTVKLVAQLLQFLPQKVAIAPRKPATKSKTKQATEKKPKIIAPKYRIILMERSLGEVLASQQVMLDRHAQAGAALTPEKLRGVFEQQLTRAKKVLDLRKFSVLRVKHADAIRDPKGTAGKVADFLDLPLDRAAMAAVIDPKLHRQKKK